MNEPVSLFEYGLFLIDKNSELYLRSAREAYKNRLFMNFLVEYNYINNIIDINVYTLAKEENFVLDETSCLDVRDKIQRGILGNRLYLPNISENKRKATEKFLSDIFSHTGYEKIDRPKTINSDLERITNLTVHGNKIQGMGRLSDDTPAFKRKP
jgi:hypothetical protein